MKVQTAFFVVCIFSLTIQTFAEQPLTVRAKRQQCRCVHNPSGGMTCSCIKPSTGSGETLLTAESQQQAELAHELQNIQTQSTNTQARCACIQIVFHGNPQYQCQCGDVNGNPLPTTTAPLSTTIIPPTTTTATTTTTPTTTTHAAEPIHTTTQGQGQCQCIMIRISGPASAHYQCNCQNTPGSSEITNAPIVEQVYTTQSPIVTMSPVETTSHESLSQPSGDQTYPLTTTCIMYVGLQSANTCSCLPQYDQCAQNICCLQAKYRSHKKLPTMRDVPVEKEPSTIDMLVNVLHKIKTKFDN